MKKILLLIFSCVLLFSCNKENEIDNIQKKNYNTQKYTEIKLSELTKKIEEIKSDKNYKTTKEIYIDKARTERVEETYDEFEDKAVYKHINESMLDKIKFSFSTKFIENNPDIMIKPEDFNILSMTVIFSCPAKDYFLFNKILLLVDGEKFEFKTEPGQRNLEHTKDYVHTILNAPYNLNSDMYGLLSYLAKANTIKIRFENDRGQHKDFEISKKEHEKIKDMYEWYKTLSFFQVTTEFLINEKNKSL
ncbi:hypothetical protein KST88_02540 [Fusobacterium nucleatum]|uniref:hypothetical protein n=1 Tax=Fusobacterium nucleatum TaxID=851 RepID=UPI0030D2B00C